MVQRPVPSSPGTCAHADQIVLIAVIAQQSTLPESYARIPKRLTYPRDRLVLYLCNNNLDDTTTILVEWIREHRCLYKDIILHQHDADLTTYAVDDAVLAHRRENALNHCRRNAIRGSSRGTPTSSSAPDIIQELRRWRKPWIAPLV